LLSTPIIAVPARLTTDGNADPRVNGANRIFHDVVALIAANGLKPVVIDDPNVDLNEFDGVVLPGGGDLDPVLYGGEPSAALYDVNADQDALDLGLARRAIELDLPVLGICRGAQVLNVALGGTLIVDLAPTQVEHSSVPAPGEDPKFMWHPVSLAAGSSISLELGAEHMMVASGHHQGIDRLGDRLHATATAADGLVEAFEDETGRILAVQWHPEAEGTTPAEQNAPFRILAASIQLATSITEETANV